MSKPEFVTAYLALKRKADAGDPAAKAEMAKLLKSPQFVAALKQLAAAKASAASNALALIQATDVAAEEAADDIIGAEEEAHELQAGDDLEAADRVHTMLPPGSDDLDHKSALRKNKLNNLTQVAPFQRINPPSVLQGTLGNTQICKLGDLLPVANWSGEDAEALPITVTLGPVQQVMSQLQAQTRAFARIIWGMRGMSVTADVDIGRGCQFTVGAASIVVQVGLEAIAGVAPDAASASLSGMLSFYPCTHPVPVTRTLYATFANNQVRFVVPAFAQTLTVTNLAGSGDVLDIMFVDTQGNTRYSFNTAASSFSPEILLGGDIAFIDIATTANVQLDLIFRLAL